MRLESRDGAVVTLSPERYQFPSHRSGGTARDYDANWLMISGTIRQEDGREWTFLDPTMTTWDAQEMAGWLRGVLAGSVPPTDFGADDEQLLVFLEPNVALSLAERNQSQVTVRIHFSLESLPPWVVDDDRYDIFEFFIPIHLSLDQLGRACAEWETEIAAFPAR